MSLPKFKFVLIIIKSGYINTVIVIFLNPKKKETKINLEKRWEERRGFSKE